MSEHTFRQGKCLHCGMTYFDLWSCNGDKMARLIEISGLKDAVKGIKKDIADIRSVAKDINEDAPKLKAELMDLRDQIREHRADIGAEASSLGNSPPDSETQSITSAEVGKVEAVAPLNSDSAGAESGR